MSPEAAEPADTDRKQARFPFDRHAPGYRDQFEAIAQQMQSGCPIAWSDTHGGHWGAAGNAEVFKLARSADVLSNDHDIHNERRGYKGVSIPAAVDAPIRGGFLEMDPPEQRYCRQLINPYLSPAAVNRWTPVVDELTRACLDERIENGRIDFVDDLANIVPAVLTLAMMGIPLANWTIYCEPSHAGVYTPPDSPDAPRVRQLQVEMFQDLFSQFTQIRENPRPGLVEAVAGAEPNGEKPDDMDLLGILALIIGGGFDTTTALTAHALEWLSQHPDQRERLSRERDTLLDSATEEFLRFYTPAVGDGRTVFVDCERAGTRFRGGRSAVALVGHGQPGSVGVRQPERDRPDSHRKPALQLRVGLPPLYRLEHGPDGVQAHGRRRARPHARLPVRPIRNGALREHRRHQRHAAPPGHLHPRPQARSRSRADHRGRPEGL
ncbi:cytochrome P450 [Streptomyces sp. NPDC002088]|uniref:cytochrome P450 n=1 Tax=Streptomyces sp. NPDC002088 TaxID=3154665 RepID=UPI00331A8078